MVKGGDTPPVGVQPASLPRKRHPQSLTMPPRKRHPPSAAHAAPRSVPTKRRRAQLLCDPHIARAYTPPPPIFPSDRGPVISLPLFDAKPLYIGFGKCHSVYVGRITARRERRDPRHIFGDDT